MAFAPMKGARKRSQMFLLTDRRRFEITNMDWRGILDFGDQSSEFEAFATELHKYLADMGSEADFSIGVPMGVYAVYCLLTAFTILVLLGAGLYFVLVGVLAIAALKGLLILIFLPTLYSFLRRNRPLKYSPENVPWERIRS